MGRMKRGAILINTARGGLIDEQAAYDLLRSGHLGGLGLDTYETEPPKQSPLFELDTVVLTPHTGAHTGEATAAMAAMSVQNLIDVLSGKPCPYALP
jgi:D-3-phosphoglycerate dehydrogenase